MFNCFKIFNFALKNKAKWSCYYNLCLGKNIVFEIEKKTHLLSIKSAQLLVGFVLEQISYQHNFK